MKMLHVGIFEDHCLGGDIVLKQGFINNSVEHHEFDFRVETTEHGIAEMNNRLIERARGFDVVFIGKGETITQSTLSSIRKSGTSTSIWYGDIRPEPPTWLIDNLHECDAFFMTSAGETLEQYFRLGKPGKASFFLNPSNPDLPPKYSHVPRSVGPPLFTCSSYAFAGSERKLVYDYLCHRGGIRIIGSNSRDFSSPLIQKIYNHFKPPVWLRGDAYIESIIRASMGIGVSAYQDIKHYSSDRLTHFLSFGTLYLAYRFSGCDDLFKDGEEIVFYEGIDDLAEKIDYFSTHQEKAETIGAGGQSRILNDYNTTKVTRMMLDVMEKGDSSLFPWSEVLS